MANTTAQKTGTGNLSAVGLFNTDSALWLNYGHSMSKQSPQGFVSLTIHSEGDLSNGREHLARFASRQDAVSTLVAAGWTIDGDIARFAIGESDKERKRKKVEALQKTITRAWRSNYLSLR